ncbi:MAG: O-antigen ligase family protein, partial [Owenweeksia sp.]
RIFYIVLGLFAFYALMLSGTRGALAVPGIGGILYLIMTRNFRMLSIGGAILLSGFIFLKYTTIGNANYDVNRLRTALDPKDASLNTRLRNRARLTEYLRDKPFGGGMGTVGSWGQRFSPGTWLANFEPDGLYTRIRAETGLIGRIFYVGMWIFILVRGVVFMWRFPDMERRNISMAILAGYAGILMANYGNSVLTQFPVSITTFISIVFVYNMRYWNEEGHYELPDKPTPRLGRKPEIKA